MNRVSSKDFVTQRFNTNRTRWCFEVADGFACYRGGVDRNGRWRGKLLGIAADERDVERFLEGSPVDLQQVS